MNQDINLYQDILIDRPAPFLFATAIKVIVLIAVLTGCVGGYNYWRTSEMRRTLASAQQREMAKRTEVAELQLKFPERQPNPQLPEKIEHLEKQLAGQKDAVRFFANQRGPGNDLMLRSLQGLAHKQVAGLWLTRVALAGEGRQVTLAGSTVSELKIPEFVELLGENHVFGGAVFDGLTITRPGQSDKPVNFTLTAEGGQ